MARRPERRWLTIYILSDISGLVNEAFEDPESFIGTLSDSEEDATYEKILPQTVSLHIHSEHVSFIF